MKKFLYSCIFLSVLFFTTFAFANNCSTSGTCLGQNVTLTCTGNPEICNGTTGNDVICVTGYAVVYGLQGNDLICVTHTMAITRGGSGNDYIQLLNGGSEHYGNSGDDQMVNLGDTPTTFRGGDGSDILVGNTYSDILNGGNDFDNCEGQAAQYISCYP